MMIYVQIMDSVNQEKKYSMTGQMSLFDFVGEEEQEALSIRLPDVGEYEKEQLLAFEKEVLGVYISGHPLEKYEAIWKKNISAVTSDFMLDEETGATRVTDGAKAVVGGMITDKTVKYTRNNKTMAFLTLEDLVGTLEVVVFPKDYEKYQAMLETDRKVFIRGRVSAEDDRPSKLICEGIWDFEDIPRELWIQFENKDTFLERESELYDLIRESEGKDLVVIYVKSPKSIKRLSENWAIRITDDLFRKIAGRFGEGNVKVVEKCIENIRKMH